MSENNAQASLALAYNTYRQMCAQHQDVLDKLRDDVRQLVNQRQLISEMNDSRWIALQQAVSHLPFPPPFLLKQVTDTQAPEYDLQSKIPSWTGDWTNYYEEGMPPFFMIEWIKVRAQLSRHRGRLIADEIIDATEEFRAILLKLRLPYTEDNGIFTLYGYRDLTNQRVETNEENECVEQIEQSPTQMR